MDRGAWPLQSGRSMGRGAWRATVPGAAEPATPERLTHGQRAVPYIPRTCLSCSWKFVPFDHLISS